MLIKNSSTIQGVTYKENALLKPLRGGHIRGTRHQKQEPQKQLDPSDDIPEIPNNFKIEEATGGGDCFFDAVAKCLQQLKPDMVFTVKSLRKLCKSYAISESKNDHSWLKNALITEAEQIKFYIPRIEFTADDVARRFSEVEVLGLTAPIWGRPDIEGRIICGEYNIKVHDIEKHNVNGNVIWTDQIIDNLSSKSVDSYSINYNEKNIIHIINRGKDHFEPVLRVKEIPHHERLSESSDDDRQIFSENLIRIVRSNDLEDEKVGNIKDCITKGADINFQDANRKRNTSLHFAVRKGEVGVIKVLLENGADVKNINSEKKTPLDIAKSSTKLNKKEVLDLLEGSISTAHVEILSEQVQLVNDKLMAFVQDFVTIYESTLTEYLTRLENKIAKPGKWADLFKRTCEIGKGGTEAIEIAIVKAFAVIGVGIFETMPSSVGAWCNRKQLKTLMYQLFIFKQEPSRIRMELVHAGVEIFQLFESQFVRVTSNGRWERAMTKIAEDVTTRIINYYKESTEEEFSIVSVTRGVLLGKSKTYKHTCTGIPHVKPGHTLMDSDSNSWNTAELFDKPGLVIWNKDGTGEKYYKRKDEKDDPSKYNYRLLFDWELEDRVALKKKLNDYMEEKPLREGYKYVLKPHEKDILKSTLLDKINNQDPKLMEERLKQNFEDETKEIIQEVEELYNELEQFISNNFNDLSTYIENHQKEIKNFFDKIAKRGDKIVEQNIKASQQLQELADDGKKERHKITEVVERIEEKIDEIVPPKIKLPVWFNIRKPVKSFTGRESKLLDLHQELHRDRGHVAITQVVAICGLGGVGKSELARKYAYNQDSSKLAIWTNAIWINAEKKEEIIKAFQELVKELKIPVKEKKGGDDRDIKSILKDVCVYFQNVKSLFIFDNAEGYDNIKGFLPNNKKSFIIITSRIRDWEVGEEGKIEILPLDEFTPIEAEEFIKKALEIKDYKHDEEINELTKELQYFPLALQQATAYIKERNTILQKRGDEKFLIIDYLREYRVEAKKTDLLNFKSKHGNDRYIKTIFTTWKITLENIERQNYGKQAMQIIKILAYVAPEKVPIKRLFLELAKNEDDMWNAIELLHKYSMCKLNAGTLNIHRLVQEVIRLELKDKEEEVLRTALTLIKTNLAEEDINHVTSIWTYARKYDKFIETFIVDNKISSLTYLHLIAERCKYSVVETIINKLKENYCNKMKEVINAKDEDDKIPLHNAALSGNEQTVKLLIKHGADVNAKKKNGWTPLLFAVKNDYVDVIKVLLNEGADVNAKTNQGNSPLHFAVKNCNLGIVKDLLIKKADINAKIQIENNYTPLHLAAENGDLDIVTELLENKATVDIQTEYKFTPLHLAARNGHVDVVKLLLEKCANINAEDQRKFTPLHFAVKCRRSEIVEILVENDKININAITEHKLTPLHFAVRNGDDSIVKVLLNKGAFVNVLNQDHFTPLHLAVVGNHRFIVSTLLKTKGIQVNLQTIKDGILNNTPLHMSAEKGYLEFVKALIANGAKIDIQNKDGKVALDLAEENKHYGVKDYISQCGKNRDVPIKQELTTFNKRKGTSGAGGQFYEIRLSNILFLQGVTKIKSEKINSFQLATNMDEAGDFDDIVLKYTYQHDGVRKIKIIFLQAKHKDDPIKSRVTIDKLLSESTGEDFSLKKYFTSFREIKEKFSKFSNSTIFSNSFEDCYFIIYTNALPNFNKNKVMVETLDIDTESFLHFGNNKHYYKLTLDGIKVRNLMDILQYSSDCKKLANELVKFVFPKDKQKQPEIDNIGIIKKYHISLAQKVFKKTSSERGIFAQSFLDGDQSLTTKDNTFRRVFFEEIQIKLPGKSIDEIRSELREKCIKLSCDFGEGNDLRPLPSDLVNKNDIVEFLNKLYLFLGQPNKDELSKIIKEKIEKFYNVGQQDLHSVFSDIESKITQWWADGTEYLTETNTFIQDVIRISIRFDVKEPVTLFTGRSKKLDQIHKALQNSGEVVISQMASITGLGGVGKSELARKYISEHIKDYDNNFIWINAESYSTLVGSFYALAQHEKIGIHTTDSNGNEKDITTIINEIYQFFSKRKSLFIFDNAGMYKAYKGDEEGISKFLPSGPNKPYVLITSRYTDWGDIKSVPLDVFTEDEALEFIRKALKINDDSQESEMTELVRMLQYLPLALTQTVSYINMENNKLRRDGGTFTIKDYLDTYNEKVKLLLNSNLKEDYGEYTATVYTTWAVTTEKINDEICGEEALGLLNFAAFLNPDKIPIKICSLLIDENKHDAKLRLALDLLSKYSMVDDRDAGIINVHRLVQQVTRINLEERNKEKSVLFLVLTLLKSLLLKESEISPAKNIYTSHAISAWTHSNKYEDLIKEYSRLPCYIVNILSDSVQNEEARIFGVKEIEIFKSILGPKHESTLALLNNMSKVLYRQGKYEEALKIIDDVITTIPHELDSISLTVMNNLAEVLDKQGRYEEALKICKVVYERRVSMLGPDHNDTLITSSNMAGILSNLGKYDEALAIYEKVWVKIKNHDHLNALNNMGEVLFKQEKYEEASNIFNFVYKERKEILGPDNPLTLTTRSNIAAICALSVDELSKALEILYEVYEKRKEIIGSNHPDTLNTLNSIAGIYSKQGKYDQALNIYNEVYEKRKNIFQPNHPDICFAFFNTIAVKHKRGNLDESLIGYKEVLKKSEHILGLSHPFILTVMNSMAIAFFDKGNLNEALKVCLEAFEKRNNIADPKHRNTLQTMNNIGETFHQQGKYNEALHTFNETYKMMESAVGPKHPNTLAIRNSIALVISDQGQYDEALTNYQDILNQLQPLLPPHHPSILQTKANILEIQHAKNSGYTSLHLAAKEGRLVALKYLIEQKNIDVNSMDNDGSSPLHLASSYGYSAIVKYLVREKKARFNIQDKWGYTPLHRAAQKGHGDVVIILLGIIKDHPNAFNKLLFDTKEYGMTPLHYASINGHTEIIDNLLVHMKYNLEKFKELIYGTDESEMNNRSFILNSLLERGAKIFLRNKQYTILHEAVKGNKTEIIKLILNKIEDKTNIDAIDRDKGDTPLIFAAEMGYIDAVKILLEYQANPNIQNNDGETALHRATKGGYKKIIELLSTKQD